MTDINYPQLASEFLRALRGRRSQLAFSRRLGYHSNVAYSWEAGRRFPTAAQSLRAMQLCGLDLAAVWTRFYSAPPAWLAQIDTTTPRGIAWVLADLRGRSAIQEIAERSGNSRFQISRWLNGQTEPRLPDFLRLFDALSLRLLDWLAASVDLKRLPSAQAAWQRLEAQRRAAVAFPWTQAVLRALELAAYAALPGHQKGWIGRRLGISQAQEQRCLSALARGGQIRWDGQRWVLAAVLAVDTRPTPADGRSMKAVWAREGLRQLQHGSAGQFSYNVFGVSQLDLKRIQQLHLAYYRQLRSIVADSAPTERVAVVNLQLFALDAGDLGPGNDRE